MGCAGGVLPTGAGVRLELNAGAACGGCAFHGVPGCGWSSTQGRRAEGVLSTGCRGAAQDECGARCGVWCVAEYKQRGFVDGCGAAWALFPINKGALLKGVVQLGLCL